MSEILIVSTEAKRGEFEETNKYRVVHPRDALYGEQFDVIQLPWASMEDVPESHQEWLMNVALTRLNPGGEVFWTG